MADALTLDVGVKLTPEDTGQPARNYALPQITASPSTHILGQRLAPPSGGITVDLATVGGTSMIVYNHHASVACSVAWTDDGTANVVVVDPGGILAFSKTSLDITSDVTFTGDGNTSDVEVLVW